MTREELLAIAKEEGFELSYEELKSIDDGTIGIKPLEADAIYR